MTDSSPDIARPDVRQEISRGIVRLVKQYYGKGPDRARTVYSGDLVLVVLRGGFTAVEQTLRDSGRGSAVQAQRAVFQEVMESRFREVVELATARKVIACITGSNQDPDLLSQLFVLEAQSGADLLAP